MENTAKKHIVLKILLALLPAVIFWQNYAWMTLNSYLGIAFLIVWALMIWSAWRFTEKNHILERYFRQLAALISGAPWLKHCEPRGPGNAGLALGEILP